MRSAQPTADYSEATGGGGLKELAAATDAAVAQVASTKVDQALDTEWRKSDDDLDQFRP